MQWIDKLILGTVQLGMDYGINNSTGKLSTGNAISLLSSAFQNGVRYLDTAEAYGNSQYVIGEYHQQHPRNKFDVITKIKGLDSCESKDVFRQKFLRNLEILQVECLESFLFHSYDTYQKFSFWGILDEMKNSNKLKKVGVSIYTNAEAEKVAKDNKINVVQMPFNLLDNLRQRGEVLQRLKENGKEIHTRSVFLQGLFFKNRANLGKLKPLQKELLFLDSLASRANISIGVMALGYVLKQPLIDRLLIGVDTNTQLLENLRMLSVVNSVDGSVYKDIDQIEVSEIGLLNPSNW